MTNSEKCRFLQSLRDSNSISLNNCRETLEKIGDMKYNYGDYLITEPVNYGEELKRSPGADYDLCCALFSMILREDHFNSGAFAKRNEAEVVLSVLDRMLLLLSNNK